MTFDELLANHIEWAGGHIHCLTPWNGRNHKNVTDLITILAPADKGLIFVGQDFSIEGEEHEFTIIGWVRPTEYHHGGLKIHHLYSGSFMISKIPLEKESVLDKFEETD
jgi:hypothetical protein